MVQMNKDTPLAKRYQAVDQVIQQVSFTDTKWFGGFLYSCSFAANTDYNVLLNKISLHEN